MRADNRTRLLLVIAALMLLPAFVTPLWNIRLVAPQYPEGLGMSIHVNDVRGHDRHDLQNINILNHYIGMQAIDPEEIPELRVMPWVLLALVAAGLGAAAIGRPRVMAAWLGSFVALGVAGLVDFYLWNIDYGHNLSPDAPIRIPDMTYSPPIIGTTQLLNIRASSYPGMGSFFLAVGAVLAGWAVIRAFRGMREDGVGMGEDGSGMRPAPLEPSGDAREASPPALALPAIMLPPTMLGIIPTIALGIVFGIGLSGCDAAGAEGGSPGARAAGPPPGAVSGPVAEADRMPYEAGHVDPFCGGEVETIRWGGELVTRSGDTLYFRSASCLAGFLARGEMDGREMDAGEMDGREMDAEDIARIRVVDFSHGWKLIDPADAYFLLTPNQRSPAGPNVMAIETPRMATNLQEAYSGRLMRWDEVLGIAAATWGSATPEGG